jgi:hypothetical protein
MRRPIPRHEREPIIRKFCQRAVRRITSIWKMPRKADSRNQPRCARDRGLKFRYLGGGVHHDDELL